MKMPVQRLMNLLTEANIPVDGVSALSGGGYRVDYKDSATLEQRNLGSSIVSSFDGYGTRPKNLASVFTEVASLSASDRTKLINAICADFIIYHPQFAKALNINIDGDEIDDPNSVPVVYSPKWWQKLAVIFKVKKKPDKLRLK